MSARTTPCTRIAIFALLLAAVSPCLGAEFFSETFNNYGVGASPCPPWTCNIDQSVTVEVDETTVVSGRSCHFVDPGGPMAAWISHPVDANSQVVLEYYMRTANQNYQGPTVAMFDDEHRDYVVVFSNGLDGGKAGHIGLRGDEGWVDPNLMEYKEDTWYYVVRVIDCNAGTGSFYIEQVDDPANNVSLEIAPNSSMAEVDRVIIYTSTSEGCDAYIDELRLTWPPSRVIYVDDDADGAETGLSWTDAYRFLQDAIEDANSEPGRTEIRVAQGIYKPDCNSVDPNGTGDRTASFHMYNHVALKGGYAGLGLPDPNQRDITIFETVLSGDLLGNDGTVGDPQAVRGDPSRADNSHHVVIARRVYPAASIDGFTITAGHAYGDDVVHAGAGLWADFASPKISNCHFHSNCTSWEGGGIMIMELDSFTVITNCTFRNNRAAYGGGILYLGNRNRGVFRQCIFSANEVVYSGGGMGTEVTQPIMVDCEFSDNTAGWNGGGLWNGPSGDPQLIRCRFTGNLSRAQGQDLGGGGFCDDGCFAGATLTDCVFLDNHTTGTQYRDGRGGAIFCRGANTKVTNCTFADNSGRLGNSLAATHYNHWDGNTPAGVIDVSSSILWDGGNEVWEDVNGTANVTYSAVQMATRDVYPGIGNTDKLPQFLSLSKGDLRLRPGSPCIDTGDPNFVPSDGQTDAGGATRVLDGDENGSFIVDMGAYEFDPAKPIIDLSAEQVDFYGIEGTNPPKSKVLVVSNVGGDVLDWTIEEDCPWLAADPNSGSSTGEFNLVRLSVETQSLLEGQYDCELTVSSATALNSPQTIPVTLTIVKTCMPEGDEYTDQSAEFMDYVAQGLNAGCWCQPPFGTGFQCDGDADEKNSGIPFAYRVFVGDLNQLIGNWKKKINDPTLNPCADMDHKAAVPFGYRVFVGDLNILIANWKKTDSDLPADCPRSDGM